MAGNTHYHGATQAWTSELFWILLLVPFYSDLGVQNDKKLWYDCIANTFEF